VVQGLEADLKVPPISLWGVLAALLVYLLVIGPLDYWVLKRLDRLEWTWVTYPLAVLVFAAGVTLWGQSGRGNQILATRLDYLDLLDGTGGFRTRSYLALYTPTKGTRRLAVGARSGVVAVGAGSAQRTSGATLEVSSIDPPRPEARLAMHASAVSFLEARWEGRLGHGEAAQPPLQLRSRRLSSGGAPDTEVEVESHLPFDLHEAVLITPAGVTLPLGALPSGGQAHVKLETTSSTLTGTARDLVAQAELELGAGHLPPRATRGPGRYLLVGRRDLGPSDAAPAGELQLDGTPLRATGKTVLRAPLDEGPEGAESSAPAQESP
jgi:hypothetical protein